MGCETNTGWPSVSPAIDTARAEVCNAAMKRLAAFAVLLVVLAAPAWAGYDEAKAAYKRGDYATALREWRPLAVQGDADAQYNLGFMYRKGLGRRQDQRDHCWASARPCSASGRHSRSAVA